MSIRPFSKVSRDIHLDLRSIYRPVTRVTRPVFESRRNSLGYWESCQILTGPFDGDSRRAKDIYALGFHSRNEYSKDYKEIVVVW